VVAFICNHCPYVVHVIEEFVAFAREAQKLGVRVIAISSNDPAKYPEDAPERMTVFAANYGFTFPYLFDESQDIARAYSAACTPDLYVFDADLACVYRGRLDESTPGNGKPVTGTDLREAVESVLNGQPVSEEQWPSIGCSIKWRR
jgi:thiol-disulfide isomerase/thioredoxin